MNSIDVDADLNANICGTTDYLKFVYIHMFLKRKIEYPSESNGNLGSCEAQPVGKMQK